MRKKLLLLAGAIVAVLILAALALPLFISANTFKPMLETYLSGALGRKVAIGNISLAILSGSVSVDSVSVADDPAFGAAPFLTAKRLSAGVSLLPLLLSKRLDVVSLTITDPRIALIRAASGRWNYSSLGATTDPPAPSTPAAPPGASAVNRFSVGTLTLTGGAITVADAGSPRITQYDQVNLRASNVSYATAFPVHLTASTPGGGTVTLDGRAGPVNPADAALTPFTLTLGVKHLDLAATGFIDPAAGIGGTLGFDGSLVSNGRQATSNGTLQLTKLRLAPNASPAAVPVNIAYATSYDLRRSVGTLSRGDVRVGKALATLTGAYNMAGPTTTLAMKLVGNAMPATDLQGLFPALGVALPSGAALRSGTLNTALTFAGPVDKLVIAGNAALANAKLTGFNLGGELGALQSFAKLGNAGKDTLIQTLSANLRIDSTGTQLQDVKLIVPAIGTLTGNGAISAAGQLNCRMMAALAANPVTTAAGNLIAKSRIGGLIGGALGALTGGKNAGAGATSAGGGVRIPFSVTGTTAQPVFRPAFGH